MVVELMSKMTIIAVNNKLLVYRLSRMKRGLKHE
jgi:hypothetical protein